MWPFFLVLLGKCRLLKVWSMWERKGNEVSKQGRKECKQDKHQGGNERMYWYVDLLARTYANANVHAHMPAGRAWIHNWP